ncbi:hypothetical protein H0H92_004621 [Tricholoma furcatifolium]|nr:hypothetical protein H0H92_004621 [Tricholoma furcatifolium]
MAYVPTRNNPADGPSRGVHPARCYLLPSMAIPGDLTDFIVDATSDPTPKEQCSWDKAGQLQPAPKSRRTEGEFKARAHFNAKRSQEERCFANWYD